MLKKLTTFYTGKMRRRIESEPDIVLSTGFRYALDFINLLVIACVTERPGEIECPAKLKDGPLMGMFYIPTPEDNYEFKTINELLREPFAKSTRIEVGIEDKELTVTLYISFYGKGMPSSGDPLYYFTVTFVYDGGHCLTYGEANGSWNPRPETFRD
ncbi:hypothetical protein ACFL04_04170 [Patescibacteria group bacterium]